MKTLERTLVDLCAEVDWLREELADMTKDRDEWREKLIGMQLQDIEHGKAMMGGLLQIALARADDAVALAKAEAALVPKD